MHVWQTYPPMRLTCRLQDKNAKQAAPFIHTAFHHPDTLKVMSRLAGVDLKVTFDYETAQVNFGIKDPKKVEAEKLIKPELKAKVTEFLDGKHDGNTGAVVNWHYDSNPFTIVLMISETDEMIGGETVITLGDGSLAVAQGPAKGHVSLIQAGVIKHLAMSPYCAPERITLVSALSPC